MNAGKVSQKERGMRRTLWIVSAVLALTLGSCGGVEPSKEASARKQITYKCLSSSCDASRTCSEGDRVPEHCGKPMIH